MVDSSSFDRNNAALIAKVIPAVQALFPITDTVSHTEVRATNIRVTGNHDPLALNAQQTAREQGKTQGNDIVADVELLKDGKRIQSRNGLKLGVLPLQTSLGSYMVGGNDWFHPFAQFRLKPGAYTREKNNGELETFIPLKGAAMSVWMDPAKGVFKIGQGTTNVNWYPIVKALGASDDEIVRVLGNDQRARDLLEANRVTRGEKDIEKLYETMLRFKVNRTLLSSGVAQKSDLAATDTSAQIAGIQEWLSGKEIDPYVTKKTLGKPLSHMGVDVLLQSARRILSVQRGDEAPDDRDAPEFKTAHGIEDLMAERIRKLGRFITRKAVQRLRKDDATLADALGPQWLNPATVGYFGGSMGIEGGQAFTAEAANPLAILSARSKTTITGEGGIQSTHAIQPGARLFRPGAANFIDLTHTPEGSAVGISTHVAANVIKEGNTIKAPFYRVDYGKVDRSKLVYLSIEEANDTVVGYPEYWDENGKPKNKMVRANVDGEIKEVDSDAVKYLIPSGMSMLDYTSNAAAFFSHTHANRGMMAGKHITQALPLVHREEALVQLQDSKGEDYYENVARSFVIHSRVAGTVTKVTGKAIWVDGVKHEIFDQYPMQAKVSLHHEPVVKVGDKVAKGALLADSNYSRNGKLALGVNLRSAYMPWKDALNYEDAIVISEAAANKLSSDHMHRVGLDIHDNTTVGAKMFMAQFPTKLTSAGLAKLDDGGVVKEGTEIHPGDILIAAVSKREYDEQDKSSKNLSSIHKMLLRPYEDSSVAWDEDFVGKVYRVVKMKDRIEVHIRTEEPVRVGDKLSMGSAAKGTISAIIPDDRMPQDEKKRPIEVIFNPHGVTGRINPSQTLEQAAGKLVKDAGVPYVHTHFDPGHADEIFAGLKKAGLKHAEILFDPETGTTIENPVAVGYNYVFKLDHPVRKKFSARAREGYTTDEAPIAGKGKSGQSFDQLTTYALLGHNAHAILGESFGVRGAKNDDYWLAYQAGETPPPPKAPFVWEKFRAMLNASGIDTRQKGNILHYLPTTDAKIRERSNGAIDDARQIKAKNLATEEGGIFDEKITGGLKGDKWAHFELGRHLPHPLYEKVLTDVTGLKKAEFYGLIGQTKHLDTDTGKIHDDPGPGRVTGEDAFRALLDFNPDTKLKEFKEKLKTASGSDANKYNRATRYLRGLKESGQKPWDAYMTSVVPLIPPKYRPIIEMQDGGLRVADSNLLYRDLILTKNTLAKAEEHGDLPNSEMAKARLALYDAHAGLIGVGAPLTERRDAELRGFVDVIKGKNNKEGLFQRQLARRRNDYTGRSTIEPDASLGPDEIAIPEDMAWTIYEPALIRRLTQLGVRPGDAALKVKNRELMARHALDEELRTRPVLYNRAPSLHRWNVNAAMPRLTPGQEIKLSPFVLGGQNADFDGDQAIGVVFIAHPASLVVGGSPMAARFHTTLPVMSAGYAVSLLDLADVPHGAVRAVKNGKNGKIAFFDAAPGLKVLSYDAKTASLVWAEVDGWSEHYDREIEIVELSSGYQIITDDDPRAVYGLDGSTLKEVRATPSEAVGKVLVPRQVRAAPSFGSLADIAVPDEVRTSGGRGAHLQQWDLPKQIALSENFGYLLGVYLGDGWVSGRTTRGGETKLAQVSIAGQVADEVFAAVTRAVQELLPGIGTTDSQLTADVPGRHGTCDRIVFSSVELARFIDLLCGHGARDKHLPAWYLAAPEEFRRGLFAGLMDTDGSLSVSMAKGKPQVIAGYTSINLRLAREVRLLANSLDIRGRISAFKYKGQEVGAERNKDAWQLALSTVDVVRWGGAGMRCTRKTDKLAGITCAADSPAAARADLVPLPPELATRMSQGLNSIDNSAYVILRVQKPLMSRSVARRVIELVGRPAIAAMPLGTQWLGLVDNDTVTWDSVESVEKTGIRETGYDLTVPGHETFASVDGVVLSNTMSITAPLTEAARKESFNLLPSKNLFFDSNRTLAFSVDKDVITGLFMLSRKPQPTGKTYPTRKEALDAFRNNKDSLRTDSGVTIADEKNQGVQAIGWMLIEEIIPKRFLVGISPPIDGPKLTAILTKIAKDSPADYNTLSRKIAQAGFMAAARTGGVTATIDELAINRKKIDALLGSLEKHIQAAPTEEGKRTVAREVFEKETKPGLYAELKTHLDKIGLGGSVFLEAKPSSKLGFDSYMQMIASPTLVTDVQGKIVPTVIKSAYGSGMTPSDFVLTTPGARAGMVAKSLSTALPGYLAKEIAGNMSNVRIYEKDCGTHKGLDLSVAPDASVKGFDTDLLDRHLLEPVPATTYKRNDVVTSAMLADLREKKISHIKVRSPMTCEAAKPPCQMCAGRDPTGKLHPLGANIGLNYGQAASERSTQITLRAFHAGGTVGSGEAFNEGFDRLRELFNAPDTIKYQGTLADHDGTITNIRPAPQGGYYVTVKPTKAGETEPEHYIQAGRQLKVKLNDHVAVGDPLSDGNYRPQEIAEKKGNLAAQTYVVDQLRKAYQLAGSVMRKPVLEVVTAAMMRWMEITDDGGEPDLAIGDVIHENEYESRKRRNPKIQAKPTVPGISSVPLVRSKDMLERLNFARLEDTLREIPAIGGKSDLTGAEAPTAGFAYGAMFRPGNITGADSAFNAAVRH